MVNKSLLLICILMSIFISTAQDHVTLETLTVENIANLQPVGQLGRGEAYKLAWKPDGETLAVVSNMGVWLYDENLNQTDYWPSDYDYVWDFAWSPNGRHLAVLTDESLTILASDGTTAYELSAPITSFSWHPFENLIAIATRESPVRILNSETGDEIRTIAPQGEYVAWSPDGTKLAIGADGVDIRNTTDFTSIMTITEKEAGGVVQWSDDSSRLSSTCFDDEAFYDFDGICVWDANTGTLLSSREVFSIIWIPDSDYRVFYGFSPFSADAGSYVIIEDNSSESINSGYGEQLRSVVWHPNYDQLTALSFYGTLVEFDFPTGEIESQQTLYSTAVATLSISPDSTRIATTKEGIVQLWDVDSMNHGFIGQPIISFDTDRGTYTQAFVDVRWVNADEFITLEATYSDYDSSVSQTITRRSARNGEMIELLYRIESLFADSPAYNCGRMPNWDFTLFACIVNRQLQIYPFDLSTSRLSIPMEHAREIIWSPDNTILAVSSTLSIW